MAVGNLKEKLIQITSNYRLQLTLSEGCKRVFQTDIGNLLKKLVETQKSGIRVSPLSNVSDTSGEMFNECHVCRGALHLPVKVTSVKKCQAKSRGKIAVYSCGHVYHKYCLDTLRESSARPSTAIPIGKCYVCHAQHLYDAPRRKTLAEFDPLRLPTRGVHEGNMKQARAKIMAG